MRLFKQKRKLNFDCPVKNYVTSSQKILVYLQQMIIMAYVSSVWVSKRSALYENAPGQSKNKVEWIDLL